MTRRAAPFIGVDLGGTNMQVGVVSAGAEVVAHLKKKTRADRGPDAVYDRLVSSIEEACAEAHVEPAGLGAIGLAVAAAVEVDRGVVIEAPNIGWRDDPLAQRIHDRLGAPVFLENDVNAAVLGEHRFGAIVGAPEALGVWVGTGVGGAIILGGALHRGALGTAGEIGHVTLLPGAPTGLSKLEETCSRSAIVARLARLARGRDTLLHELAPEGVAQIKSRIVAEAYTRVDPLTRTVVDESADLLGVAIGSAVTLLGMGTVLMGGGLVEAIGDPYVQRVASSARERVFPHSSRDVRFVQTALRERAGVLGAVAAAQDRLATGEGADAGN